MHKSLIFNVDQGFLIRRPAGAYRIAHFLREHDWDVEVVEFAAFWTIEKLKQLCIQRHGTELLKTTVTKIELF